MTKKRDREYEPKPQYVELKHEEIPQGPSKISSKWCKKGKAEHIFELDSNMDYLRAWHMEIYRCTICGRKKHVLKRREQ